MKPLLSILMPALQSRDWRGLLSNLELQAEPFGGMVEVVAEVDNGEKTSGVKRQALMNNSTGLYVAFVDDDDEIAPDYVESLMAGCDHGPDVVTFDLEMTHAGRHAEIWSFDLHPDDRKRGKMAANHLCAWRRDIAERIAWCPDLGYGDDQLWYRPMHALRLASNHYHIPRVMYGYRFCPSVTSNQTTDRIEFSRKYCGFGLRVFTDQSGNVYVEQGNQPKAPRGKAIVRDRDNDVLTIPLRNLSHEATVRIS